MTFEWFDDAISGARAEGAAVACSKTAPRDGVLRPDELTSEHRTVRICRAGPRRRAVDARLRPRCPHDGHKATTVARLEVSSGQVGASAALLERCSTLPALRRTSCESGRHSSLLFPEREQRTDPRLAQIETGPRKKRNKQRGNERRIGNADVCGDRAADVSRNQHRAEHRCSRNRIHDDAGKSRRPMRGTVARG